MRTIRFKPNNQIPYGQDHRWHKGVPPNIDFEVEMMGDSMARLRAPGYGGTPYGNGAIYLERNMWAKAVAMFGPWMEK